MKPSEFITAMGIKAETWELRSLDVSIAKLKQGRLAVEIPPVRLRGNGWSDWRKAQAIRGDAIRFALLDDLSTKAGH